MPFQPAISYDSDLKVWSGDQVTHYFDPHLSIGEIIFHEMRRHPKLIAQISPTENTVLTREQLHANSMHVASYMRSMGLLQSDVVGIIARNTTHIFAVTYACFFNGIAFHSLNIAYEQNTIEKLFDITKPKLIFCDGDEFDKVRAATVHQNIKIITMRNHPSGSISIDHVLATPIEDNFLPSQLEQGNDQTLAILCSSGTTGIPKAVTITNSRQILAASFRLTTDDVQFTQSTLDWITGLLTTITSGVFSTKRIISDNAFDAAFFMRLVEEYKITWTIQAPAHMAMMVNCSSFEGESLGPDEVGEICIHNGQYWAGYYGNPAETHLMRDSQMWFHSGDLGYVDDDGFIYIVERKKDMLKYQNIMYYPNEVESVISEMPDVVEVCVFGVWDQIYGDEAAAAVVKKQGSSLRAQDVVDYVAEHTKAKYKQLNGGAIIVEDLKRSPNGKTNRMANKAHFLEVKNSS